MHWRLSCPRSQRGGFTCNLFDLTQGTAERVARLIAAVLFKCSIVEQTPPRQTVYLGGILLLFKNECRLAPLPLLTFSFENALLAWQLIHRGERLFNDI